MLRPWMRINWVIMTHFTSREKRILFRDPTRGTCRSKGTHPFFYISHPHIYWSHAKIPSRQTHPVPSACSPGRRKDFPKNFKKKYARSLRFPKKLLDFRRVVCIMVRI